MSWRHPEAIPQDILCSATRVDPDIFTEISLADFDRLASDQMRTEFKRLRESTPDIPSPFHTAYHSLVMAHSTS